LPTGKFACLPQAGAKRSEAFYPLLDEVAADSLFLFYFYK